MHSIEIKNWITALVVGILGLTLTSLGIVLAYKQLRRTKRPDDVESAGAETIEMAPVAVEATENHRATSEFAVETCNGAHNETEAGGEPDCKVLAG